MKQQEGESRVAYRCCDGNSLTYPGQLASFPGALPHTSTTTTSAPPTFAAHPMYSSCAPGSIKMAQCSGEPAHSATAAEALKLSTPVSTSLLAQCPAQCSAHCCG